MAWENKIVGYEIAVLERGATVPPDSTFLQVTSDLHTDNIGRRYYEYRYHYHVPIYKKVRTKK